MNVVAAIQSPTLLNILATSREWKLTVRDLGDTSGLAETALLKAPFWDADEHSVPDVVLVCTPDHLRNAERLWPMAAKVWVLHNGRERGLLPPDLESQVAAAIAFSHRVCWLQGGRSVPVRFISPAYEAHPTWHWWPHPLWALRNRPTTRCDDLQTVLPAVTAGLRFKCYGQGQPDGFADEALKETLLGSSTGYVAALDRCAGFGLGPHECFARGVPVLSQRWGDLDSEMSADYWGLTRSLEDLRMAALHLAENRGAAADLSRLGIEYIRKYRSVARMEETICEFKSAL